MRTLDPILLKNNIEARSKDDISSGRVGGIALSVKQNGETVYKNFFGSASMTEEKPITDKTVFRIASMTKPITAVATLILMEKGLIGLHDPLEKYLPFFKDLPIVKLEDGKLVNCGIAKGKPTVFNVLTHTSGIGGGDIGAAQYEAMSAEEKASLDKSVEFYARAGIQFEPFAEVLYSGTAAFDALTAVIEKVTDMPYEDFLKKNIFEPLGMTDTTFNPSAEQWARMIDMHDYDGKKGFLGHTFDGCVFEDIPTSHPLGGAGLVSTIEDYSRFAEMLLCEGENIVTPDSVKLMSEPLVPYSIQQRTRRWGLAVKVVTDDSTEPLPLGAYGWSGAYGTHFWVDPKNKITAVYMKNSQFDGGGGAVTNDHFERDVMNAMK